MASDPNEIKLGFNFVMPLGPVLEMAENSINADNENIRAVAKAILDVANEAKKVQSAMAADGTVDLAPYFDFWFADAIAAANTLLTSDDETTRHLGECLIEQEKAIIKSKAGFLEEMKRRGIRPQP